MGTRELGEASTSLNLRQHHLALPGHDQGLLGGRRFTKLIPYAGERSFRVQQVSERPRARPLKWLVRMALVTAKAA